MPLSEHEQQVLDALERDLLAENPNFGKTFDGSPKRPLAAYLLGGIGLLAGLGVLVLGAVMEQVAIGVLGFLLMFAAVAGAMAMSGRQNRYTELSFFDDVNPDLVSSDVGDGGSFMDRLEKRWDRRAGE